MEGAKLSRIANAMELTNYTISIDLDERVVTTADINRPALQLYGFYEDFEKNRIQLVGNVEMSYLDKKTPEEREKAWEKLLSHEIPCVIFCRGYEPEDSVLRIAQKYGVPLLGTKRGTSSFMSELIYELADALAPSMTIHGVLVDVYGEGLLIMGESGIGKSEAALELIRRGHRLVADDLVDVRKINDDTLMGYPSEITKHFIELRGIGVIDVKSLFGVEAVKERQKIGFVIKLEEWNGSNEYDRIGMTEEYMDILGNQVPCHSLPIRPGRNLAVICETAAVNYRQKKMGYNAAEELYRRVQANMEGKFA